MKFIKENLSEIIFIFALVMVIILVVPATIKFFEKLETLEQNQYNDYVELKSGDQIILFNSYDDIYEPIFLKPGELFTYTVKIGENNQIVIDTISTVDNTILNTFYYNGDYLILYAPE